MGDFWWKQLVYYKRIIAFEYSVQRGILRSQHFLKNISIPYKLQFGSGPFPREGWINSDISESYNCKPDVIIDLRRHLPFSNKSCSTIYSNHVFEHLPYPNIAKHVLDESYRILIPGGCFRVVVPDLDAFLESYQNKKDTGYIKWVLSLDNTTVYLKTRAEIINLFFRQWGEHHFAYDFETLSKLIYSAGFKKVEKSHYDSEIDTLFRDESIYINAYK